MAFGPALSSASPHPPHHRLAWRWLVALTALLFLEAVSASVFADSNPLGESSFPRHAVHEAQLPASSDDSTTFNHHHDGETNAALDALNPLEELHSALQTMQNHYFELWLGIWPSAIDWTAAVMSTFTSATLHSLTRSLDYIIPGNSETTLEGQRIENEINKYFSHTTAYYFGEDAFGIRMQAYDDMLWVVLGWLENIRFINMHADLHYRPSRTEKDGRQGDGEKEEAWYGKQFEASFAHRAHIFYDIASKGWDDKLCGGGMTWNPNLTPYKNAITNQLFISASIGMYLYFPGDSNASPFMSSTSPSSSAGGSAGANDDGIPPSHPHSPHYLHAAKRAYRWLRHSNMTNAQGLYVDGFHIRNWGVNNTIGTGQCDVRNEMVYTYNQGVVLSGLRGLWEATGELDYLLDGHTLVRNVVRATGWHDRWRRSGGDDDTAGAPGWAGLGRAGILEEYCDHAGTCSQDGQTFKGIFFHHLTAFCAPLPRVARVPGKTVGAGPEVALLHQQSCREYAGWVALNARMALGTRDARGRFGGWWGGGAGGEKAGGEGKGEMPVLLPTGAVDYRNNGSVPVDEVWVPFAADAASSWISGRRHAGRGRRDGNVVLADVNDRGRGRTVETQGGGVAVVRAMWEFVNVYRD
ncbi:glycoside hydrolase family 76 protein [Saccharata proteae CBS 121410]|uniref:Glycoside hydrolase family 76 protein n=1 Tax=Saccharata proteae CBS 121410 TaxID=1314787 RepID=A0A9P4M1Z0_9PEZI|nr:glycoside hydrolase family 76 protein [Saccharata proteae CBS 121410]